MTSPTVSQDGFVVDCGRYAGYRVVVGEHDYPKPVYYDENIKGSALLRVHFRLSRVPSRRAIMLRHLGGSTDADRAEALRVLPSVARRFALWEASGAVRRTRWALDRSKWLFYGFGGTPVSDPLVQLELEMMIDLGQSASLA